MTRKAWIAAAAAAAEPPPADGQWLQRQRMRDRAAGRDAADLVLRLDEERERLEAAYDGAQAGLNEWRAEFFSILGRQPNDRELRESPAWADAQERIAEAEAARAELNAQLELLGESDLMPTPPRRPPPPLPAAAAAPSTGLMAAYSAERVRLTLLRALGARVLQPPEQTLELRRYFSMLAAKATTAVSENGFALVTDEQLEQAAVLFSRYDADSTGLLTLGQWAALLGMVAAKTGANYTAAHTEQIFREIDIDSSGTVDLNELLLFSHGKALR